MKPAVRKPRFVRSAMIAVVVSTTCRYPDVATDHNPHRPEACRNVAGTLGGWSLGWMMYRALNRSKCAALLGSKRVSTSDVSDDVRNMNPTTSALSFSTYS